MITTIKVGSNAVTRKGNPGIVEALEADRVILRCPDGQLRRVPLDAIARWELPHPFPISSIVHKRFNVGWTGMVVKHVNPQSVEVIWWMDKHPTLMAVSNLRMADDAIALQYRTAFKRKGVEP